MSSVTRSTSLTATQLLATIGTAASALTTTFNSVGNIAEELNIRSTARLDKVREQITLDALTRSTEILDDAVLKTAMRLKERDEMLSRDTKLKTLYDATMKAFEAKLNPAPQAA
jgi:hypothetical protein